MGLIFSTISEQGLDALLSYGKLILVLVGSMAVVIFIINPVIVFIFTRQNPFPLVFTCLKGSFITAFFTRSSAANIPVNMELCKKLAWTKIPTLSPFHLELRSTWQGLRSQSL